MTKERELLKRALEGLENRKEEVARWGSYVHEYLQNKWGYEASVPAYDNLIEEIRAYLAAEEGKEEAEPAAFMHDGKYGNYYFQYKVNAERSAGMHGDPPVIPLYLHPAPSAKKREPLSEEEIDQKLLGNVYYSRSFTAGVRFAEKHHGIGGRDDTE